MRFSDYRIRAVSKGKDALGEVQIELEHSGRKIRGRGLSTDILEASALAYIAAINRLRSLTEREKLVMSLYYDEELNLKEIGAVLGVSESRVCQIHGQALIRLRARMSGWKDKH